MGNNSSSSLPFSSSVSLKDVLTQMLALNQKSEQEFVFTWITTIEDKRTGVLIKAQLSRLDDTVISMHMKCIDLTLNFHSRFGYIDSLAFDVDDVTTCPGYAKKTYTERVLNMIDSVNRDLDFKYCKLQDYSYRRGKDLTPGDDKSISRYTQIMRGYSMYQRNGYIYKVLNNNVQQNLDMTNAYLRRIYNLTTEVDSIGLKKEIKLSMRQIQKDQEDDEKKCQIYFNTLVNAFGRNKVVSVDVHIFEKCWKVTDVNQKYLTKEMRILNGVEITRPYQVIAKGPIKLEKFESGEQLVDYLLSKKDVWKKFWIPVGNEGMFIATIDNSLYLFEFKIFKMEEEQGRTTFLNNMVSTLQHIMLIFRNQKNNAFPLRNQKTTLKWFDLHRGRGLSFRDIFKNLYENDYKREPQAYRKIIDTIYHIVTKILFNIITENIKYYQDDNGNDIEMHLNSSIAPPQMEMRIIGRSKPITERYNPVIQRIGQPINRETEPIDPKQLARPSVPPLEPMAPNTTSTSMPPLEPLISSTTSFPPPKNDKSHRFRPY